ncbi:MAG: VOC family protein [Chloroflexi bacterium]|nr:VOC family protein [Chloroflexota bacterium]
MAKLNHIHLKCKDPNKTAQWYIDNLGAKLLERFNIGAAPAVRIELEGTRINISSAAPGETLPPGSAKPHLGLEHFGLEVTDLAAALARLEKAGAKVLEPMRDGRGGGKIAFIQAPDNVRIEMMQPGR